MIKLLRENYSTYVDTVLGKPERQLFRFVSFIIIALCFSLFSRSSAPNVYSMMATGITVLTGFTFTALFSDHALASFGLPKSKSEDDRQDLVRLDILSQNFRARSAYFIVVSILEVVLLVAASFSFDIQPTMNSWPLESGLVKVVSAQDWFQTALKIASILSVSFTFVINLIYLECLYTFYRMAETIIAILDTRRTYLKASREDGD